MLRGHKGNALFLILIAVALFAALSYAVTRSGRGSGSISKEQAGLLAAQITASTAVLKQGVQRLILLGTAPSTMLCTDLPNTSDCGQGTLNSGQNFCTTGTRCIFAPEGGGLTPPVMPQAAYDTAACTHYTSKFAGTGSYNGYVIDGFFDGNPGDESITGLGTGAGEDMVSVRCIKQDICAAINRGLGISGIPSTSGAFAPIPGVNGLEAACVFWGPPLGYVYYQVLNVN